MTVECIYVCMPEASIIWSLWSEYDYASRIDKRNYELGHTYNVKPYKEHTTTEHAHEIKASWFTMRFWTSIIYGITVRTVFTEGQKITCCCSSSLFCLTTPLEHIDFYLIIGY